MSGYAFANADTPVPDFLRMALELGAMRCLRKPFTPVVLMTVVNECLAERPVAARRHRPANIVNTFLAPGMPGPAARPQRIDSKSVFERSVKLTSS